MSKKGIENFIEKLRSDWRLADDFGKAVADIARREGYDVDALDVMEEFVDGPARKKSGQDEPRFSTMAMGEEEPRVRPPSGESTAANGEEDKPSDRSRLTTLAMGEENRGRASVTLAIGEEDTPRTRPLPGKDEGPKMTTFAMGEEDKGGRMTSMALGEEGNPPKEGFEDFGTVTSAALGEEGAPRGPQSSAMGEGGNIPAIDDLKGRVTSAALGEEGNPPARDDAKTRENVSVTCALGEEDKKSPPAPTGPQLTTLALGEEDKGAKRGHISTRAVGEEDGRKKAPAKRPPKI